MNSIHVFQGGEKGEQSESFIAALNDARTELLSINETLRVEIVTVVTIKNRCWRPIDLVDWLLASDAHFIIAHVHQGKSANNVGQLGCNMMNIVLLQMKTVYFVQQTAIN